MRKKLTVLKAFTWQFPRSKRSSGRMVRRTWKRFLLPVTYFLTNLVYPFTLRVTGITRKNTIVECLDYLIPVT